MTSKFSLLPADAVFDGRLQPQHLRCLAAISYYGGNKNTGCWPSYKTVAKKLKTSRRSIISHINHLIECGYIVKELRTRPDNSSTTNVLRVKFDVVMDGTTPRDYDDLDGEENCTPECLPASPPPVQPASPLSINHTNLEPEKIKYTKKAVLVSLQDWEKITGAELNAEMLKSWCQQKKVARAVIAPLIDEFRTEMIGKGKQYADFRAAFQTYLTKGYLSMTLAYAQEKSRTLAATEVHNRGVNL